MPRKPSEIFTDKELEIMRVIWDLKEATARQIQERLADSRHYNSVLTIIRVLEKKGHLAHREEGKTYVYRAIHSRAKSHKKVLRHLVKQVFGGSVASLVLNLVETGDLTSRDLEEIRERLEEHEQKGSGKKR